MKLAKVPVSVASETIPRLMRMDVVNRNAKISKGDGCRLVPILDGKEDIVREMGFELVEGSAHSRDRTPPQERILKDLADLPKEVLDALPMRWEFVGDIAIIRLEDNAEPYKARIGEVYADELDMSTICVDRKGVSGEFRRPSMEIIYGSNTESVRLENGILYDFDVTKVMFASGNLAERKRMKCLDCAGETVVDMFCGIGYFTLPLAKYSGARRVFACEKNPQSYGFLLKNLALNGIDNVIPLLGDNRDIPGRAFADRILMGYVQTTSVFVPKALEMAKPGCIIHYHDTFPVGKEEKMVREIFDRYCGDYTIERIIEVKSFAPGVSHYVADIRV
jgi:tRNA wybutosine-synthesizing protein 2